jgi:hypothetical protein
MFIVGRRRESAPDKHQERKEPTEVLVVTCAYVPRVTVIH